MNYWQRTAHEPTSILYIHIWIYVINALLFHARTLHISHARGRSSTLLQICFSIFKRIDDGNIFTFFFLQKLDFRCRAVEVFRWVRNSDSSTQYLSINWLWTNRFQLASRRQLTPRAIAYQRFEHWTRTTFGINAESTRHSIRYTHLAQSTDYFTLLVCYFGMGNAYGVLKIKTEMLQMVKR